jgi:hypothetical protein
MPLEPTTPNPADPFAGLEEVVEAQRTSGTWHGPAPQ